MLSKLNTEKVGKEKKFNRYWSRYCTQTGSRARRATPWATMIVLSERAATGGTIKTVPMPDRIFARSVRLRCLRTILGIQTPLLCGVVWCDEIDVHLSLWCGRYKIRNHVAKTALHRKSESKRS